MPRGVRNPISYDTKISAIDEKIEKLNRNMANLKIERQDLVARKRESEMKELSDFLSTNNMTIDDVITRLSPILKVES